MSKKSFNDIEAIIRSNMEANEPAFNEASWKKMEAMLDKEDDRRRPFIFWLWILVPLLVASGGLGYYAYNKSNDSKQSEPQAIAINDKNRATEIKHEPVEITTGPSKDAAETAPGEKTVIVTENTAVKPVAAQNNTKLTVGNAATDAVKKQRASRPVTKNRKSNTSGDDILNSKNRFSYRSKSKTKVAITSTGAEADDETNAVKEKDPVNSPAAMTGTVEAPKTEEDIVVVKIETDKTNKKDEKEIEKIVDSVIAKTVTDKKDKKKISRFFVIVAAGVEGSGTKLFSVDKITSRIGAAVGYNITSRLSVQTGFFTSSKKYKADGSDYKAKPGSYWSIVDINSIDANCRVYEIPLQVNYNFTSGKKLNFFASAGISSYIMKREDYSIYYSRYGTAHHADAYYKGNKNLFSVLKLSGGVEKKIGKQFSIFAAPGVSIPLAGVGEGEVKLYSTELMFGLKFTPARKNK